MLSAATWLDLDTLSQGHIDFLLAAGIATFAMIWPVPILSTRGFRASDGRFDPGQAGEEWLAIEEVEDWIFWNPETGELALDTGRAFALGEAAIGNPGTFAFDGWLNVYADPLDWLAANRDGIVPIPGQWHLAFERLRDCPRVAIVPELLETYEAAMSPRVPELAVFGMTQRKRRITSVEEFKSRQRKGAGARPQPFETIKHQYFEARQRRREFLDERGLFPAAIAIHARRRRRSRQKLLALQLSIAVVGAIPWIGVMMKRTGPALYLSAEDDLEETHLRYREICQAERVSLAGAEHQLELVCLAGQDATLAVENGRSRLQATPLFARLVETVEKIRPALLRSRQSRRHVRRQRDEPNPGEAVCRHAARHRAAL